MIRKVGSMEALSPYNDNALLCRHADDVKQFFDEKLNKELSALILGYLDHVATIYSDKRAYRQYDLGPDHQYFDMSGNPIDLVSIARERLFYLRINEVNTTSIREHWAITLPLLRDIKYCVPSISSISLHLPEVSCIASLKSLCKLPLPRINDLHLIWGIEKNDDKKLSAILQLYKKLFKLLPSSTKIFILIPPITTWKIDTIIAAHLRNAENWSLHIQLDEYCLHPCSLGSKFKFAHLTISSSRSERKILTKLAHLKNIDHLRLYEPNWGDHDNLAQFTRPKRLSIDMYYTAEKLSSLQSLPNLFELIIRGENITDEELTRFSFPCLEHLTICNSKITGIGLRNLSSCSNLHALSLWNHLYLKAEDIEDAFKYLKSVLGSLKTTEYYVLLERKTGKEGLAQGTFVDVIEGTS